MENKITLVFKGPRHTSIEQLQEMDGNELIDYIIQLEEEINNRETELMKISAAGFIHTSKQKQQTAKYHELEMYKAMEKESKKESDKQWARDQVEEMVDNDIRENKYKKIVTAENVFGD